MATEPPFNSSDVISPAIVAALGAFDELRRDKKANVPTKTGGSYSYSYTDLGSVLGYVRPILAENGLVAMQPATCDGGNVTVTTILLHRSGQERAFPPLALPAGRTPQEVGSAITYARRYSLLSALGLATEDDDGAAATKATRAAPARRTPPREDAPPPVHDTGTLTLSEPQMKKVRALYSSIGIRDAADQKHVTSLILGVPRIGTHSDLTVDQASTLIEKLTEVENGYVELVTDEHGVVTGIVHARPVEGEP